MLPHIIWMPLRSKHSITVMHCTVRAYHLSICIPGGRGDRGRIKSRAGFCGQPADAKLVLMHNSGGRGGGEALSVLFPFASKLICRRPSLGSPSPSSSRDKKVIMQLLWFSSYGKGETLAKGSFEILLHPMSVILFSRTNIFIQSVTAQP